MRPLLIVGDGPAEPTGLGRIARDLCHLISQSDVPVELVQVGGSIPPAWTAWEHYPLERDEDWGAGYVKALYESRFGDRPGIVWVIWDPGRLLPFTQMGLPVQLWTYTAVDGFNRNRVLSGPAAAALQRFDRVLGYGRWAAKILKQTLGTGISYLPHGLVSTGPYSPEYARDALGPYRSDGTQVVGCVMTNQFRKDHATYFGLLRGLLDEGYKVFGWLHSDVPVKAWSLPQLVEDFGLQKHVRITTYHMTDSQLRSMYEACAVTVLPSLGEGFGYPIVESLAAGTPVVHGHWAGGAELVPRTEWRVPVRQTRLEGIYALERPVWDVRDWVNATIRALDWREAVGDATCRAYCAGSVAHLNWQYLWPRWQAWIRKGL